MASGRKGTWIILTVIVGVIYLASDGVEFLVDYLWFDAQGYLSVFRTIILAELGVGFAVGAIVFAFLVANLLFALRQVGDPAEFLPQEVLITPLGQWLTERLLRRLAVIFGLGAGTLAGLTAASDWESLLLFFSGGSFDVREPVFGYDAGFYIFQLPLLERVQALFWVLGVISLLGVGFLYFLRVQGNIQTPFQTNLRQLSVIGVPPGARGHLASLGAFLLIVMAAGQMLDRFEVLYRAGGLFTGPGYAEVNGTLPMLALRAASSVVAAIVLIYSVMSSRYRLLIGMLVLWGAVWIGGNLYTTALQRFIVNPNELNKEEPYLVRHIQATNQAYALDQVEERSLDGEDQLTLADIQANRVTINNVRLWDHEPLLDTFSQIQEIRTYYEFQSVDNDRYLINGELRQTMLSPRELQKTSLPSRTWVNERMTFTHGYGITMGPVNRVNEQGLPELFIKNIPPQTEYPELAVTRPELYYGEVVDDYVFVKTDLQEFNYPEGEQNIFADYEGTGGVNLGSLARRLLFALYLRDIKILLAEDFRPDTRVLLFRNVLRRVNRIAPFFRYDSDPYLALANGRLFWILDAYTLTPRYPYSEQVPELGNYMRNPVKVVVDAYNGTMQFYRFDTEDPIARAYNTIFPELFQPWSNMPAELVQHIRHPVDYFRVQTFMYATYHMLDPNTFYNKEDQWEVPIVGQQRMEPYYTVMRLPEEASEEFILMLPFTPRLKDNLAAWMVARSDGEHYGKLVVYRFPKQKLIFGPRQIVARINQDAEVSQQITLWDQSGSNVIRGTLLVIPVESSLLYIQPLYLKAEDGRIPELKRVIVGYQNEISMGLDLEDALAQIFGGRGGSTETVGLSAALEEDSAPTAGTENVPSSGALRNSSLANQARAAYEALQEARRRGDWRGFGDQLNRLGELLRQMSGAEGGQ